MLLLAVALALGVYAVAIAVLAVVGRRTAAKEVAAFLPNLARLFKGLIGDSRVPRSSKVLLVFGAAWIASPIDRSRSSSQCSVPWMTPWSPP